MIPPTPESYLVIVQRAEGNFGAYAPDLPGCVATGATVDECAREMRDAIAFHLAGMREDGEPVPQPTVAAATFVDAA